ncbi:acetoacetate--CoA ligase [Corallincola platygyrae]|uniref:Acetoacetate--CoA ligase n=1 Tax=Corallincola platygyrae TaxID=1193278 RepID=A0ABW4XN45_9GAMM
MSTIAKAKSDKPIWQPTKEQISASAMDKFRRWVNNQYQLALQDYDQLHRWSIEEPERFWQSIWLFCEVRGDMGQGPYLLEAERMPGATWFPDAQLNYAENLLYPAGFENYSPEGDDLISDRPALVAYGDAGVQGWRTEVTYAELRRHVAKVQKGLIDAGVGPGDVVAGYMPNSVQTVIAMLATAAQGAIWTSCSPDFGIKGVLDRFGQTQPKVLFTVDAYEYGGKVIPMHEKVSAVANALPSLNKLVQTNFIKADAYLPETEQDGLATYFQSFMDHNVTQPEFHPCSFNDPLFVLYSSGTTGSPKCIVHGVGGTLLQHRKEHLLHCDLTHEDTLFFFTTCGWMMWNWLVSGLAGGATLILFDGNPLNQPGTLWQIAEQEQITAFGTSAKYLSALEKSGYEPGKENALPDLKLIMSTGSPLAPTSYDYVYQSISSSVCLSSISGGTDIVSCFALGNPTQPVYRGELQSLGLGMDVAVFDSDGHALFGKKGELVCCHPFPSMPVGFWGDDCSQMPHGQKYHDAYFDRFCNIWAHGDYAEITPRNGLIIYGRADAVLNPGGVRIGTAEIYRQVEQLHEVEESLAIGQPWQDDQRVVLFVVLKQGLKLSDILEQKIRKQIRDNTTPRHVPAKIIAVSELPRTISGKLVELAVKQVVMGEPVTNTDALANPKALALFKDLPELQC